MPRPSDVTARSHEFVITLSCMEQPGIVHAVSSFLLEHSGNICESQQFDDRRDHRFFMRVQFDVRDPDVRVEDLRAGFARVADAFRMSWNLQVAGAPTRTLLMVSRFGHCLNDLLFRHRIGALNIEIPAIVSNHREYEALATSYDIPFHHVPVTADTKPEAEEALMDLVDAYEIDLVVLARYMQVLSNDLCKKLEGRAINIHHSFLPSFKGARPHRQAHDRGVKLIGATAHYVTADLDEGPIIEQDVARVDHAMAPDDLVAVGRDVEAQVLARAVSWHSQHRVLLNGARTVVFR
ncbi:MAG TPA: formyltetrahydrofolate deformylase [Nocardioidaceae bacterium]|nr:formyltetrahydrofolate deformylase [Nocardioidaceae bacterium]